MKFHEDRPVSGKLHPFCVPAGRLMIAGGLIPRMITKRFPRHGVTVQNGRELIALSAVKPLEASLRDGSQIGIDVRGLKPTAIINRPSGTGATIPQNQSSNHKHSCSQFGFWNLKIGTYLEIGSWKFPSLRAGEGSWTADDTDLPDCLEFKGSVPNAAQISAISSLASHWNIGVSKV